ncbi:uncharacterized protein LOC124822208, partial [Vigna umbellata]|uniref:uncharacterized protein LOC124822208 n=1 Tax=Vigna umbellata TaxID=87088 RepID=UPI001F5F954C
MEFHCLALFFSLIVILMAAQAALPPEVYWERMLPNTPIPKVIRELSKLGYFELIMSQLQDGAKEISSQEKFPYFYTYGIKKKELQDGGEISSQEKFPYFYGYGIKKNELQDGVKKNQLQDDSKEIPSQDETPYDPQLKENAVLRGIGPVANHHHHDHSKPSLFFLEEGLRRGTKLDVQFPKRKFVTPLLPREITEHLPFSSEKINEI